MPARIVVDEAVPTAKRPQIVDAVRAAVGTHPDVDSIIAVVTQLPSGRLTVFVNHVSDPSFVAMIEAELARLK